MKKVVYMALMLACVSVLTACTAQNQKATAEVKSDMKMAENFEFKDLNGKTVMLSDYKGQNVYLKYWASWCPICLGGLEDINTLSAEDKDITVFTIVAPGNKGEKNMADFKEWFAGVENTEHIQVLFDEGGAYTQKNGVRGYPTSEWIGKDGNILKMVPGHVDNDTIKAEF